MVWIGSSNILCRIYRLSFLWDRTWSLYSAEFCSVLVVVVKAFRCPLFQLIFYLFYISNQHTCCYPIFTPACMYTSGLLQLVYCLQLVLVDSYTYIHGMWLVFCCTGFLPVFVLAFSGSWFPIFYIWVLPLNPVTIWQLHFTFNFLKFDSQFHQCSTVIDYEIFILQHVQHRLGTKHYKMCLAQTIVKLTINLYKNVIIYVACFIK